MSSQPESRKQLGARGEEMVRRHLQQRGWHILATNFRCPQGEMDLIAEEPNETGGSTLVFIEVKTRRSRRHGAPVEAVDHRKQRKLTAVAHSFLAQRDAGGEEPACRFDVAEVEIGPDGRIGIRLLRALFAAESGP